MMCRKLSVFFMVSLVACSCLWALPGAKKSEKATVAPTVEEALQVQETLTSEDSQKKSEEELNQISQSLNGLLEILGNSKYLMGADKIEQVLTGVTNVAADVGMQNALIEAQNQQIDALKKELKKTRFFADFGVSAGVKGDTVKLGILGEMGMVFNQNLLVKTGLTWSAFDAKDLIKVPSMSIEDLTMSCAVGWQW